MAEKGFGVKEINLIGASGTPTIESPNNLNLNAVNVAISTNVSIGGTLSVTGNVSVGGTLTYEDVTSIDSVGLITARSGVVTPNVDVDDFITVGSNIQLGNAGIITAITFAGAATRVDTSAITTNNIHSVTFQGSGSDILARSGVTNEFQYNPSARKLFVSNITGFYNSASYDTALNILGGANVTGVVTATSFSGSGASLTGIAVTEAPVTDYTISANGSSAYRIHGGGVDETANSPDLYLIRGQKYRFNNTTGSGHPFALRVSNGGSAYTDGVSGSQSGIQFFTVPYAAPASLVYQCTIHGGMVGNIYIRGGSSTAAISNNADNRIITGGSGGNLNGEANLTFTGSALTVTNSSGASEITLVTPSANDSGVYFNDGSNAGALTYLHSDNSMKFRVNSTNKMTIDSDGAVNIGSNPAQATGTNTQNAILTVKGYPASETSAAILALVRGNNSASTSANHTMGRIVFADKQAGEYAFIEGEAEANGAVGDTPGRLVFSTAADNSSAPSERLRIDSTGRMTQNGTTSIDTGSALTLKNGYPSNDHTILEIMSDPNQLSMIYMGASDDRYQGQIRYKDNDHYMSFWTDQAERMRINSSGNLQIGCTAEPQNGTDGVEIRPSGSIRMGVDDTGGNNLFEFNNPNGNVGKIVCSGSNTSYQTSSDYRLKENVVAISDGITRLKTLKPSRFNFKADAKTTFDGFLAHEVSSIVPEAISGTKDEVDSDNNPVYQGIDQSKLVPLLTAALQEAIAKIEVLETKVAALEAA